MRILILVPALTKGNNMIEKVEFIIKRNNKVISEFLNISFLPHVGDYVRLTFTDLGDEIDDVFLVDSIVHIIKPNHKIQIYLKDF